MIAINMDSKGAKNRTAAAPIELPNRLTLFEEVMLCPFR